MAATNKIPAPKRGRNFAGHWVCFSCRKMFRKSAQSCVCPHCAGPMVEMGPYFEPPKRSNRPMWETLKALARDGYRFHTEGSRAFFTARGLTVASRVPRPLCSECASISGYVSFLPPILYPMLFGPLTNLLPFTMNRSGQSAQTFMLMRGVTCTSIARGSSGSRTTRLPRVTSAP